MCYCMGRIQVVLSDELEKEFRAELSKNKGFKKGNLSLAIEEAIKAWIAKNNEKRSRTAKKAWQTRKTSP